MPTAPSTVPELLAQLDKLISVPNAAGKYAQAKVLLAKNYSRLTIEFPKMQGTLDTCSKEIHSLVLATPDERESVRKVTESHLKAASAS